MPRWLLQAYLFPQKFVRKQGEVSHTGLPIYVKDVMRWSPPISINVHDG